MRIAMWSGPRNLSTAMMRAFGNRADAASVRDEPFYAAYLATTGKAHPMRDEILARQPQDWRAVAEICASAPLAPGRIDYQKHMTHHMIPAFGRGWMAGLTHVFLIRAPERVVASYAARRETATLEDLGFLQQAELFDYVTSRKGSPPPVIDAERVRADPQAALRALCAAIDLGFDPAMLRWLEGARPSDGVWGAHWYASDNASTGFAPPDPPPTALTVEAQALAEAARPAYHHLQRHAL